MRNVQKHLPEPILGSCLVTPKGAAVGSMAAAALGPSGSMAKAAADTAASQYGADKAPIDSGLAAVGMLALTADDVVLINGRRGMLKPVATGLAGRVPRRALSGVELGKGKLVAPLRLSWADGSEWELNVPRAEAKKAQALLAQLTAA